MTIASLARWSGLALVALLVACGGSSDEEAGAPSNRAELRFDCDLQGAVGRLTMEVEAIGQAGVVFGPGPTPDISGVISTGGVLLVTSGELVSDVERYVFTGENQFADFTELSTFERFRVQWAADGDDLVMVVNPFGPGPATHRCERTDSRFL